MFNTSCNYNIVNGSSASGLTDLYMVVSCYKMEYLSQDVDAIAEVRKTYINPIF